MPAISTLVEFSFASGAARYRSSFVRRVGHLVACGAIASGQCDIRRTPRRNVVGGFDS